MAERLNVLSNRNDRIGERFGELTVVEMLYSYVPTKMRCVCDCGNEVLRTVGQLKKTKHPSCGCSIAKHAREERGKDICGERFGKLEVLETLWDEKPAKVRCRCECGNTVILSKTHVISGHTKSCGCTRESHNMKDYSGYVSSYGITILERSEFDKEKGRQLWFCKCGVCGEIFSEYPFYIVNGLKTSCGCVKKSSRAILIERTLKTNGVDFKREFAFGGYKDIWRLRFDFALIDKLGNAKYLIEYDGEQHFKSISIWGGEDGLTRRRECDEMKNVFCKEKNIPLLRLPYTLTDEEIIEKITNIINP